MLGSVLVADVIGSPYYWAGVAALTVAFSVVDFIALDPRDLGRRQGWAVALYIGSWGIVLGLSLPIAPVGSLWWVFPWGLRLAVTAVLIGSTLLAWAARAEQAATHPDAHPKPPRPRISEAELRAAERYDAEWQAEDRERNREQELHQRLEHEHQRHAHDH
jgi:hypothetical protein